CGAHFATCLCPSGYVLGSLGPQPPDGLMRNPLRTEEGAFRLLLYVLAVAVVAIIVVEVLRAVD
ncbi:MAG TPA: hypothetical protein VMB05_10870, partial [Solirubrobacteraceae bacterium]|nr:hypothetical protein [Solirubrobacteraceae bacterium]